MFCSAEVGSLIDGALDRLCLYFMKNISGSLPQWVSVSAELRCILQWWRLRPCSPATIQREVTFGTVEGRCFGPRDLREHGSYMFMLSILPILAIWEKDDKLINHPFFLGSPIFRQSHLEQVRN
jgi:hypothetical protein